MPGNIQCFEVVIIVLDLRSLCHAVTGRLKQRLNSLDRPTHRMQAAGALTTPWQTHINSLSGQLRAQRPFDKNLALRINCLLYLTFGLIDFLTGCRSLFGWQRAQALQQSRQLSLLAQIINPQLIKRALICAGRNRLQGSLQKRICVGHGFIHSAMMILISAWTRHAQNPECTKPARANNSRTGSAGKYRDCYCARLALAWLTSAANAALSCTARSAITRRSTAILAFFRPAISWL